MVNNLMCFITKCNNLSENPKVFEKNADIEIKGTTKKDDRTMGMAASQARLLTITARIHDVEHEAQSIEDAKLKLATQSDQVYADYLAALDACVISVEALDKIGGTKTTVAATFNNLCSKNRVTPAGDDFNLAIRDRRGRLVVENNIFEAYQEAF